MKVSLIGSGNMGSALAKRLTEAGHAVAVASRDAASAEALARTYGVAVVAPAQVDDADVVILATRAGDAVAALQAAGDLAGRVVVDVTNPLTDDFMGLTIGHSTSSAEEIARAVPGLRLVKGFNTVFAQLMAAGPAPDGSAVTVFLASDDADAKATVTDLARSLGFAVTDAGPLRNARYLEPLAGLNVYLGYGAGHGTAVSPAWVTAA